MINHLSFELFHLMQFNRLNRKKVQHYLKSDRRLNKLNDLTINDLQTAFQLSPQDSIHLYNHLHDAERKTNSNILYKKFSPLTIFDSAFPKSLKQIPDPPLILYWKGNLSLLSKKRVAVIGSRRPSKQASLKINTLLKPMIENDITIVSGLAYGIDAMSHQLALQLSGNTIAVLGFGFHHIYPKQHLSLFQSIAENGLIISEYPPHMKPQKWHFPERNRLISGLSSAVLIIEAAEKSGTMITADQALEQGKEVFAVPDSIFLNEAKGCLKLIQEGATPIINGDQLLEHLTHLFRYEIG